jgi:hypothetical protein
MKHFRRALIALTVAVLLTASAAGCSDEPAEEPVSQPEQDDAQACKTPVAQSEALPKVTPEGTPHLQSAEESLAQDLALMAEALGITVEEAEALHLASEALSPVTSTLARERPDIFVGAVLSGAPGEPARIYIKGPADDFVRDLVAGAGVQIEIVDNQPYSFAELEERQTQVTRALVDQGFTSYAVGTDIATAQIEVDITREAGLPDDADEILVGLPAELRDSVELTLSDCPVSGPD